MIAAKVMVATASTTAVSHSLEAPGDEARSAPERVSGRSRRNGDDNRAITTPARANWTAGATRRYAAALATTDPSTAPRLQNPWKELIRGRPATRSSSAPWAFTSTSIKPAQTPTKKKDATS